MHSDGTVPGPDRTAARRRAGVGRTYQRAFQSSGSSQPTGPPVGRPGHPQRLAVDPGGPVEPGPPPVAEGHRLPVAALGPARPSSPAGPTDGCGDPATTTQRRDFPSSSGWSRTDGVERHPGEDHRRAPRVLPVEFLFLGRGEGGPPGEARAPRSARCAGPPSPSEAGPGNGSRPGPPAPSSGPGGPAPRPSGPPPASADGPRRPSASSAAGPPAAQGWRPVDRPAGRARGRGAPRLFRPSRSGRTVGRSVATWKHRSEAGMSPSATEASMTADGRVGERTLGPRRWPRPAVPGSGRRSAHRAPRWSGLRQASATAAAR